jgi:hypothetical protein
MAESTDTTMARPRATTGRVIPILRVTNPEARIDYFVTQLGFAVEWRSGEVASVKRDRTSIMLCEGARGNSGMWLWIGTSDVDAMYADWNPALNQFATMFEGRLPA